MGVIVKHGCRGRLFGAAAVVFVLAAGWVGVGQALAATRYAAPSAQGSGDCSSAANACTLATAVSGSAQGETVILAGNEGTYGTSATPLSSTIQAPSGDAPGLIEGAPGQPRPAVYTNADPGFNLLDETTVGGRELATDVSNLDIEELASGLPTGLFVEGNVDHVIVRSLSGAYDACAPLGLPPPQTELITDSLCEAAGTNASALGASSIGTAQVRSVTLRNDTLYATGLGSRGLNFSIGGFTVNVSATNVIAHGADADVSVNQYSGGSVSAKLDHSNYATISQGGGATATAAGTDSNQTAAPEFVDSSGGDFHEIAGSPTLDAGVTDSANGSTDLDGNPRTVGPAPDIGAFEYQGGVPVVLTGAATSVTSSGATLTGTVNAQDLPTTWYFRFGPRARYGQSTQTQAISATMGARVVSASLTGLLPGTKYHFQLVGSNALGTAAGGDGMFTTAPTPPNTKITKVKVNQKKGKATFKFRAIGKATGFQCKLKREHHRKPKAKFRPCSSPKTYKHLKPGKYTFKVRALGPGGTDPTPAKSKFKIKR